MENPSEINGEIFTGLFDADPVENEVETDVVDNPTEVVDADVPEDIVENEDPVEDPVEASTSDYITEFLSGYGVENGVITYENEDGTTEDVKFADLDDAEKLNILKELATPNLSEDEIATINYLRRNNVTIQDVIEYYSNKAVDEYINKNGAVEKRYSVDEYSDDELYIAELKSKYSDMTDDEIRTDLESAKDNEALFKKKVDAIRNQYKAQEEAHEKELAKQQEDQYNAFKDTIYNQINDFNEIPMDYKDTQSDSIQIENSEKDAIYNYILRRDENGLTQFYKDVNDPQKLVEIAWFAMYGKDAISDITNYWKAQLKNSRKADTKVQQKAKTTVLKTDVKPKDNFMHHHNSYSFSGGDDLL